MAFCVNLPRKDIERCGRRDLNPHTQGVSDFKSEASADSATAARKRIIAYFWGKDKSLEEEPHGSRMNA